MYKKILIALAPDQMDAAAELKAAARALADEGASILALSVIEIVPSYIEFQVPSSIYEMPREDVERRLEEALSDSPDILRRVEVGNPAATIRHVQETEGCDVVVLRSHSPALKDWVLGTTAGRVVRDVNCSIHVLR
ncbi:universal stress protein [Wenxinia saemankumensis]|uniref:Nucleotide-binding universal stress protein, UspA family n=1 Tax=Wenxinia saemankumensis TaxID=1447782 RepID=A0A1M6HRE2_9RHOB|nr:universal stress protein [Wenxinia saemankumensis]SHJ24737.1 Nucleotide-binding universal stress protein, UspA family [Wenxinia saemankumensis]